MLKEPFPLLLGGLLLAIIGYIGYMHTSKALLEERERYRYRLEGLEDKKKLLRQELQLVELQLAHGKEPIWDEWHIIDTLGYMGDQEHKVLFIAPPSQGP